jgi:hypothetical protein
VASSLEAPVTLLETWTYSSGGLVARNTDSNGDINPTAPDSTSSAKRVDPEREPADPPAIASR